MHHARSGGTVDQGDMYHILTPERQRQYGPFGWNRQWLPRTFADPECLIELAGAVLARIGGVEQEMDVALSRRHLDLLGAGEKGAGARLEPEPVKRRLAQCSLGAIRQ